MPCSDTTSRIRVRLDEEERVRSVSFRKVTCGRNIGGDSLLSRACVGLSVAEIVEKDGEEFRRNLEIVDVDEGFLFHLEWDALQAALARYTGDDDHVDPRKYKVASIISDGDGVEITVVILPPAELPPIAPCSKSSSSD